MIGQTVSHYRILDKLGEGGMGVVYKAEDTKLKRLVALKFLPPDLGRDNVPKKRFLTEARAIAALDHPNICNIHEIGETRDGRMFICMALYEGETLQRRLERGPLPLREALDIGIKVCRGLANAHKHGIVHRDVKPGNIMLTNEGEVKVLDFGLAKLIGATRVTRTGATVGTVAYMSPEQTRGEDLDACSDIFSLGAVLYELVTGKSPFGNDNEAAVVYRIACTAPEPLSKSRSDANPQLQQVIEKALQKNVNDRYQSAADLEIDLQRVLDGLAPFLPRVFLSYRVRKVAALLGVTAAAILAAWLIPPSRHAITRLLHAPADARQVVVLPFENVGNDASNQAFCDGLMETLTSQLTQLEQFEGSLWVVPASEVRMRQVGSPTDARRTFGVNLVISGGVQRFDRRFRVTLNLIDVSDSKRPRQLKSSVVDGLVANVAVLQDTTVAKIAGMLGLKMAPEFLAVLAAGGTDISSAYERYLEGRGYLQRYEKVENIDRAILAFEHAVERDSLYALAYAGLGEAYWRKYRATMDPQWVAEAWKNGRRAVELDNQLAPVRVTLGMIYSGTGEHAKAIAELQRALALDPENAAAYQELAIAYAGSKRLEEAEAAYKKAIEIRPQYWGGYYQLGFFYYRHDRRDDAVSQFQKVVELSPDNAVGYNSLGAVYYQLERWDEAVTMFTRSIEIAPSDRSYSNLGNIYYMRGQYADAADVYRKALDLNDTNHSTWANLANAYYWMPGKRDEAFDIYRRAAGMAEEQRKIKPKDPWLLTSLAGYYAVIGERGEALALADTALAIEPDNSRIAYFAGFAYEHLGEREKAVELIARALKLGYPLAEFERDQWLVALRSDARFEGLWRGVREVRTKNRSSD